MQQPRFRRLSRRRPVIQVAAFNVAASIRRWAQMAVVALSIQLDRRYFNSAKTRLGRLIRK
jgi:hypothetical protein